MSVRVATPPVTGLSTAQTSKELRVDFVPDRFVGIIEIKGYRLAWQRAALCPCLPINDQTAQPDPNCTTCKGIGWLYFKPSNFVVDTTKIGDLDDIQTILANRSDTVVIRGVMSGLMNRGEPYDKLGHWASGASQVTVRYENKIGYYDRITNLDSLIVFSETVTIGTDRQANIKPRYPIVEVNLIRSLTTEYTALDLDVVDGDIVWKANKAPAAGSRLVLHYNCHPTWLIIEHPHAIRSTFTAKKLKSPPTPVGAFQELPIQALVRYEFLPVRTSP